MTLVFLRGELLGLRRDVFERPQPLLLHTVEIGLGIRRLAQHLDGELHRRREIGRLRGDIRRCRTESAASESTPATTGATAEASAATAAAHCDARIELLHLVLNLLAGIGSSSPPPP